MKENLSYLFLSGLILGSGPCLSFCAPILFSYVSVFKTSSRKAFFSYAVFSAGKIFSYMLLGALCGVFSGVLKSRIFEKYLDLIYLSLGAFILVLGISTVALKGPLRNKYCLALHKGNIRNVGVLGFLTGFAPCLPLLGVLDYIVIISHSWIQATVYAFVFGVGTILSPLILLVVFLGKVTGKLEESQKIQTVVRVISGIILCSFGAGIILSRL